MVSQLLLQFFSILQDAFARKSATPFTSRNTCMSLNVLKFSRSLLQSEIKDIKDLSFLGSSTVKWI